LGITYLGLSIFGGIPAHAKAALFNVKAIGQDIWDKLRALIQGTVVAKQQEGYESLRKKMVHNGLLPREQPDAIVQTKNEKDLGKIVSFARSNGLRVSVRGRGHHVSAPFMQNNCILVDISGLNSVQIDKSNKRAIAGAGVTGKDFLKEVLKEDLVFPVGHVATVPMSGFLLGGGYGWNSGAWGVACGNVLAVDVVNAQGEIIHANDKVNQDFYWAARGGGAGFFGIVTRYHLQLFPNPKFISSSTVIYSLEETESVVSWLDNLINQLEPEVELGCFLASDPKSPSKRNLIITATAFANTKDEARRWLQPLDQGPKNHIKKNLNITKLFSELEDNTTESGAQMRFAQDTFITDEKPSEYLSYLFKLASYCPSPHSVLMVAFRPASLSEIIQKDMAFSMIGNTYIAAYGAWKNPVEDEENRAWVNKVAEYMTPFTKGHYVNESDLKRSENRASQCFSKENWTKLEELRKVYDPEELFTYFP
jgi:FAD/FMN-containing dehydrogenase